MDLSVIQNVYKNWALTYVSLSKKKKNNLSLFTFSFDPPVEMRPGDELRTTCTYKSSHRDKTVYFGQGTQDEMCYGFITYYPSKNIRAGLCMNWKSVQRCQRYLPKFHGLIGSCEWRQLLNVSNPVTQKLFGNMQEQCPNYDKERQCTEKCAKVAAMAKQHPCLQDDDIGDFIRFKLATHPKGKVLVDMLKKCSDYVNRGISIHFTYSIFNIWFIILWLR